MTMYWIDLPEGLWFRFPPDWVGDFWESGASISPRTCLPVEDRLRANSV
jgi:hypothetical protein